MACSPSSLSSLVLGCLLRRYTANGLMALGCLVLSGCDPVTLIAVPTAVVGGAAADERGVKGVAQDTALRTKINYAWLAKEPALVDYLTLSVQEGRALVTGVVPTEELKQTALAATRGVSGVGEVIDEIKVGEVENLRDYARDGWITTKLKTELLCNGYIASRNYSIRTVNRVIYLTGIAKNQQELNLVLQAAKGISGVRRVVNYVRIKDKPERWTLDHVEEQAPPEGAQP